MLPETLLNHKFSTTIYLRIRVGCVCSCENASVCVFVNEKQELCERAETQNYFKATESYLNGAKSR